MEQLVIQGYRLISKESSGKLAPTNKTSDVEILMVYKTIVSQFHKAADIRGEHIPAVNLNYITLQFLQIYEFFGKEYFKEHLDYQLQYYLDNGLREDYKQELDPFGIKHYIMNQNP